MANVWCTGRDVAGAVCKDARLRKRGEKTIVTTDQVYGQAGWDVGIHFQNCRDLTEKLKQLPFNGSNKIAINSHGEPGKFYINGKDNEKDALSIATYSDQLKLPGLTELHLRTASSGIILFVGCQMASGKVGSQLLEALSKNLFPGRRVVAFTTIGFDGSGPDTQQRQTASKGFFDSDGVCTEPGSRDTPFDNAGSMAGARSRDQERYFTRAPTTGKSLWEDLDAMPWASETSKHAKVALDGKIIAGADLDPKETDTDVSDGPVGRWTVKMDKWTWIYELQAGGKARWTDPYNKMTGTGSWTLREGRIRLHWKPSNTRERWNPPFNAAEVKGMCEMEGKVYALSAKRL